VNTEPIPVGVAQVPQWKVEFCESPAGRLLIGRSPDLSLMVIVTAPSRPPGAIRMHFTRYSMPLEARPLAEWEEILVVAQELVRRLKEGCQ
jgi:hypothetical protein